MADFKIGQQVTARNTIFSGSANTRRSTRAVFIVNVGDTGHITGVIGDEFYVNWDGNTYSKEPFELRHKTSDVEHGIISLD